MANSCVVVTPALRVKAKEYNVSISTMSLATQSWLDKGNRLNMSEELFNKYLDSYFKKNTSIPYKNKEIYEKATILWKKYNGKVFDKFSEGKKAYVKAIQYFKGENTILCELPEGKYELRISKPVFSTTNKTNSELQEIKEKALRDGTFMKAPNGQPTNLTEKQWLQVRTKAFKDWFGDWEKAAPKRISLGKILPTLDPYGRPAKYGQQGETDLETREVLDENGNVIGEVRMEFRGKNRDKTVVLHPTLNVQGKGYGQELYQYIANTYGIPVEESFGEIPKSNAAKKMWNSMQAKGLTQLSNDPDISLRQVIPQSNSVSKVVDENGEPLVVYHGREGENGVFYEDTLAYFDRNKSNRYGNNIVEVFLNIRKPYYEDAGNLSNQEYYELQDKLEQNSSDGFISLNKNIFVTSDPIQIKSATDNIGSFSRENDNIYFEGEAVNLQSSKMHIDTRLQDLYNANRRNFNINTSVFTKMIEGSEYSDIRNLINKINEGNKKLLEGIEVKFVSPNNLIKGYSSMSMAGFNGRRAYYNSTNNIVYVNVDAKYENGDALSVIMHELLHAVTVRRLATNLELKKEFEKLLDEYLEHYPRELTYSKSNKHRVEEFVANIWSNKDTIQKLKNIKYKDKTSLWDKIKEFFKNLLFKDAEGTMFQKASETMVKLLESPANVNVDGLFYESSEAKLESQSTQQQIPAFYEGTITPDANTIFVFGSNPKGIHGAGAAYTAKTQFGAIQGQGEGMQGNAYALPTKDLDKAKGTRWYRPGKKEEAEVKEWYKTHDYSEVQNHPLNAERTMTPQQIIESIKKLYKVANQNPDKQFKVSHYPFGQLSLNGYLGEEMLAMFKQAGPIPSNVVFSKNWTEHWNEIQSTQNLFNTNDIDNSRVDTEIYSNPKEHEGNTTLKIYLKNQHEKGHFELVKDREEGYYSVHLKTDKDKLEKGDTKILFEELNKAIPVGAKVSTWGSLSEDGIRALNENIGRGMVKIGERNATKKSDNSSIKIPIWQKINQSNTQNTGLEDTTTTTSKLEEAREKINKLKAESEARVVKGTNFKEDHTYYRKVNGKLVPVKYSVTDIKSKVNPDYHESAIDDRWKLPASVLGNINDDIMRAVFSMRDPNNKKSKLDIKSEARAKALASQNMNDAQFNVLWKKVIDEEKGIFKQISSIVGDKWECTSDEIILLGKVNNEYVAGTPDLIVWNDKGEFFIFDFKTLRSTVKYENKKLGWSTQVYTYGNMMHSMAGINIKDARAIVTSTWYPDAIKEVIYYEENGILKMKDIKTQNEKTSLQNYDAFKKQFVNSNPNGVFKDVFIENLSVVDTKAVSSAIEATAKVNEHTPAEQSPCEEDFGKEPKVPNSVVPTPTEVKKIKELKSLDDLPVREKKMLADSIMYSVSDAIDILQTSLEEDDLIADLVMSHPKLKGTFEERKKSLSQMSRLEIINTIGLNNLFRFVKESEFSDEYMEVEEDKVESMKIAYNNFDALCSLGYSKLLTLEKISPVSSNEKELNFYEGDEELKDSNDMGVKEEDERESWQTNFRNQSMIGSLATEVRGMFEKLPTGRHDKYGYKRNEYEDPNRAIVITQKLLSRCNTIKEMEKVLEKNAKYYQWMYNILDAIKEDNKTGYNPLRHKFFRNFRKDFTVYSTVVPRFNRNTHKYEYDVYTINTKGAEQSILDTAKVNFEFNINQKLFKKEGDVYKPDTKGLAEVYAGAEDIYRDLRNQTDVEKFIPKLYKILTEMGISDKVLSDTTFRTIIQKQDKPVAFIKNLLTNIKVITGATGTATKVNSKDNPLDTKFNSAYSRLVYMLAEYMDDYTESSTYENGKMYYSYCNPSYMGKMVRNLTNMNDTNFNKYIFEHYGQFKFFKNDEKSQFRTEMLERLAPINTDTNQDFINKRTNGKFTDARDILQHKVELTFDKEGYKDYDEFKETMSFILNFFHSEAGTAWYRIPIYANKPSNEFYRFIRYEDDAEGFKYKDHISKGLFNTFQQELMRMKMILEMATEDEKIREKYSIKNRNIPEKTLKNLKWNGKDLTIGYVPGTNELDINIYHLRALIEENKKKPNGCNFKFLDGLNDILMKDYKEGTKERKLQEYIIKKLRATPDDMVGNKSIDNTSIVPIFKDYINDWMTEQYNEARKEWERIGILEEDKKHNNYKYLSEEKISGVKKPTKKDIDDALENYFWNDMYATINIIQLTVTDVSYYKNIEDFQKRYAQLHAPALRFDEYAVDYGRLKNASGKEEVMFVAKQEVNRSRGQIEPRAYHRTIYIADDIVESDIIPNVTKAFDIVIAKERTAGHTIQAGMLESKKDDIIKSFKEINVADAQGYTSPTAYRKLKYMSGEWTEEMEDAYLELMKGNFDISNMNLLMQPLKPFVYTQISKNTNATTLSTMPVPIQNKNSEYALMLSYAIMKGAGKEGSRIAAIYDFMEESAYDGRELKNGVVKDKKEGTYNGRGIDTIQFESAVKSGLQGVLNINDSAIEDYRKQQDWENLTDYEIVKRVLKEHAYESDGQYNQAYVHEIPFEDYGEQQAVPDHFQDHEQPMGSQIRILDVADAENPDEKRYKVNGKDELLSMRELREEYFQLQSDNIEESIKELQKEFLLSDEVRKESVAEALYSFAKRNNDYPLKSLLKTLESKRLIPANSLDKILKYESRIKELNNFVSAKKLLDNISRKEGINFAISKAERNYILSDLLVREVQKDQRYGADLLEAVSINPETGDFNIPLSDEVQSQRIQRLLNSIIKKNINKQKIKGGPVVQASVYGASSNLKVVFADKEGKPMEDFNTYAENYKKENEGKTFTEDDIKEAYKKHLTDNQAGLSHFEIYITCPSKELEDLLVSKSTKDKDYMTNPQDAVKDGIIPKEILDMIGYRIPTEDKYSMQPCKVKGFLPRSAGEVVMLPKEITLLSGSDFDIDKLYVMTKSFIYKDGKFNLNTFGNEGRNNRIFDLQWSVLTNSDTMSKMFNPGSFDMHKESVKRIEILEAQNTKKLNTTYTYEDLEKMGIKQLDDILSAKKQKNIIFSTTQVYFHKQNMTSGKLIGIFANNNTSHAFVNIHNDNEIYKGTNNPIVLNIRNENCTFTISKNDKDKNPLKIGSEVIEIDKLKSHDGVTLISKILASYLAASVDAVKDPVLDKMNINNITAGPAMVLTRLGCNPDTVGIILKQPIIEKILDKYNKANNTGYKSIDKVVKDILDENIKDTETYLKVHHNLNFDLSKLSKNIGNKIGSTKKLDETQLKVTQLFYNLLQMAKDLNELTLCTKFNSLSNTVGPLISDTMVTNMRVSKFQEKCATDEDNAIFSNAQGVFIPAIIEKNPMLNSFYKTFTEVSRQMFKGNFPHYSNAFDIILNELSAISGDKGITADIIDDAIDYWAVFRATRDNVFSFDENKKKYFLSKNFINKVQKIKDKEELKENQFIQTLQENIYKGNPYVDIKGGGLTSEQQEDIKTSWASLLESDDEEIQKFAFEIAEYFVFRGGFGFNPKTVMHLMPNKVKMNIEGYNEVMSTWSTSYDEDRFVELFIRNIYGNKKLSNKFITQLPKEIKQSNDVSFEERNGKIIYSISSELMEATGLLDKTKTYPMFIEVPYGNKKYIGVSRDSSGDRVNFELLEPLGSTYNYIEMDYNTTSPIQSIEDDTTDPDDTDSADGSEDTTSTSKVDINKVDSPKATEYAGTESPEGNPVDEKKAQDTAIKNGICYNK